MSDTIEGPEGRKFYGSVKVGERGQIVIPAETRKDFNIKPGEQLLVLGDLSQGIALTTIPMLQKTLKGSMALFNAIQSDEDSNKKK